MLIALLVPCGIGLQQSFRSDVHNIADYPEWRRIATSSWLTGCQAHRVRQPEGCTTGCRSYAFEDKTHVLQETTSVTNSQDQGWFLET